MQPGAAARDAREGRRARAADGDARRVQHHRVPRDRARAPPHADRAARRARDAAPDPQHRSRQPPVGQRAPQLPRRARPRADGGREGLDLALSDQHHPARPGARQLEVLLGARDQHRARIGHVSARHDPEHARRLVPWQDDEPRLQGGDGGRSVRGGDPEWRAVARSRRSRQARARRARRHHPRRPDRPRHAAHGAGARPGEDGRRVRRRRRRRHGDRRGRDPHAGRPNSGRRPRGDPRTRASCGRARLGELAPVRSARAHARGGCAMVVLSRELSGRRR